MLKKKDIPLFNMGYCLFIAELLDSDSPLGPNILCVLADIYMGIFFFIKKVFIFINNNEKSDNEYITDL
jgi:hypothetical protein